VNRDPWKHRRRIAYVAFAVQPCAFVVGMGIRLFVFGDDPNSWTAIASMTLGSLAGIVLGYTGAATYDQVKQRDHESQS